MAMTRSSLYITILYAGGRDTSLQCVRGHIIKGGGAIVRSIDSEVDSEV